ncbi:hypothetical protein GCM10011612_15660 [Actinomyces gaoshouyii]|uniref:Uncharacterized protein n=1 Tax=Actinomyces gaoshouyii TaxID=1960083 RepID=A0A8H9HBW9_9ACTO|nr:hypothetical protein GCM10011612_15660 [Actinomyces gaoshouyii]
MGGDQSAFEEADEASLTGVQVVDPHVGIDEDHGGFWSAIPLDSQVPMPRGRLGGEIGAPEGDQAPRALDSDEGADRLPHKSSSLGDTRQLSGSFQKIVVKCDRGAHHPS